MSLLRGQRLEQLKMADVDIAMKRIRQAIKPSPILSMEPLNIYLKHAVYTKAESLQPSGSFKLRGAYNKIASICEQQGGANVITASSGNHALGVSLSARWLGQRAVVVVPETAPAIKKDMCRALGADVIEHGQTYDDAYLLAKSLTEESGAIYIHPVADTDVVAGQGTIALEIVEQIPDVEQVVIPIGGGGLASGISFVMKTVKPNVKVVGVQAEGSSAFYESFKKGQIVELERVNTIADGLSCKKIEPYLFDMIVRLIDDIVLVSESLIKRAIRVGLFYGKLLLEGAGAASLAAVLGGSLDLGRKTVVIASGSNIDKQLLINVINENYNISEGGGYM